MLSRFDTFGMAALDAMAASLPVVFSGNVGAKDLVRDGLNGFVIGDPADAAAVAERFAHTSLEGDARKRMGEEAFRTACGQSWDNVARRQVEIYEKLAGHCYRNADSLEFGEPTKLKVNVEVFLHDTGFISATSPPSRRRQQSRSP